MINTVVVSKRAFKQLKKVPQHIAVNFQEWVAYVQQVGIEEARKRPGYHDEPLLGDREGQRSIRLSRSYRTIYVIKRDEDGEEVIEFVFVEEVNKHDY